ncbi:hypothetical protein [Flavobacterium hydatis]|uniref:Peptidase S74 domain-containing protein n=1 Tax=Flavobacterium hydatis TaxID=991 RepID=A0ABX4CHM3_FLAHY|nr:hypothetical protein [Flavobacterium hydatis]OXA94250.1 hypothetical protein B0A62_11375 [Flavobacterium hydatis]
MKRILLIFTILIYNTVSSQIFSTNTTPVGWEHNILFNAGTRYTVTQQGPAFDIPTLFDGRMMPHYTSTPISVANPSIITIEGLPEFHIQAGAWIGWTTRYWPATRFKIEGFDTNSWVTFVDYSSIDYSGFSFSTRIITPGTYTKLKFTFYTSEGANGNLGLSELFFIHPEATTPYAGLFSSSINNWEFNGTNLAYSGNVGIGTATTGTHKLAVDGSIGAREIKVEITTWPDYVFKKEYSLPTLTEVEKHIIEKGHLKDIPTQEEALKNGINLGEMNAKLLQKIEELTLYMIVVNNKVDNLEISNKKLSEENKTLLKKVIKLESK